MNNSNLLNENLKVSEGFGYLVNGTYKVVNKYPMPNGILKYSVSNIARPHSQNLVLTYAGDNVFLFAGRRVNVNFI